MTSLRSARAAAAAAVVVVVVVTAAVAVVVDSVAAAAAAVVTVAAAVVVVAADKHPTEPTAATGSSSDSSAQPQAFADGTQPAPKVPAVVAEGTQPEAAAFRLSRDYVTRATSIGEAWLQEYVRDLRAQQRDIVGGWPGTLREARRRVFASMPRDLEAQHLDELARIANLAARRGWESVSEPDLEP